MNLKRIQSALTRRMAIPAVAVAGALAFGVWTWANPANALPAQQPLDSSSVAPMLSLDQAMENLAAHVTPTIVNITVAAKTNPQQISGQNTDQDGPQNAPGLQQFFGPGGPFGQMMPGMRPQGPQIEHALGSGVIISPDGYIVTNNHVVNGAFNISVTTTNRDVYPAKLIGTDPLTDLAVIKISGHDLPYLPWGDSTQLRQGETVMAFGNPYGFSFSMTRGIVSALNRPNPDADRHKPGLFIQTDAAINQGNSGGALVDARGQLVGINTFLISPTGAFSGMGFAIPSEIVKPTVATLIKDGHVSHGVMGVSIEDVTPANAKFFNVTKAAGAVVSDVSPDSPGAKAGLKTGDVITAVDGKTVSGSGQLQVAVTQKQPGDTVHLTIMRDGKTVNVPVTLGTLHDGGIQELAQNGEGKGRWGLGLADLSPDLRQQAQVPANVRGAIIEHVRSGSPADVAGLTPGDVIVSVNRKPVDSAAQVAQQLGSIPQGQDALVLVWSNGGSTFRVLHPSQG
jgi:serine protease Do